jgi:hypothetical protein
VKLSRQELFLSGGDGAGGVSSDRSTTRRPSFVGNVSEETTLRTVRTRNGKRKRGKWIAGMNVFVSGQEFRDDKKRN